MPMQTVDFIEMHGLFQCRHAAEAFISAWFFTILLPLNGGLLA